MMMSALSLLFVTLLISEVIYCTSGNQGDDNPFDPSHEEEPVLPPTFRDSPTKFEFTEGEDALLKCFVDNLRTKKIIWRRKSAPNPLTIGYNTFVDDERITVVHELYNAHWHLSIERVRLQDAGQYECQISSKNRELRRDVTLVVKKAKSTKRQNKLTSKAPPKIAIYGDTYIEKGGRLKLVCNATGGASSPDGVDWFWRGQKLTTDLDKKLRIDERVSLTDRTIYSTLVIDAVTMDDTGVYLCRTSSLQVTSTRVDVLNADSSNVKRGTEKDSSGKLYDRRKSGRDSLRGDKGNSSRGIFPSCLITYLFLMVSILTVNRAHIEIFSPT